MSPETINLLLGGAISLASICLTAIVTIIASLLTLIVTIISQNRRELRAREWELEDRQSSRRLSVWGMRIKEARDFVDTWETMIQVLLKYYSAYTEGGNAGSVAENLAQIEKNFGDLDSIFYGASRQVNSLILLGDEELTALHNQLLGTLSQEENTVPEIMNRISQNSSSQGDELETLSQVVGMAHHLVTLMKIRLDKLDQQ